MRLLLDTHVFLALLDLGDAKLPQAMADLTEAPGSELNVSVASLWEVAIKVRSRKMAIGLPLDEFIDVCNAAGTTILDVAAQHVLADLTPEPTTRDPFDRLLLAQASVEGMRLVTLDRALADHPLAWAPAPPPPAPP